MTNQIDQILEPLDEMPIRTGNKGSIFHEFRYHQAKAVVSAKAEVRARLEALLGCDADQLVRNHLTAIEANAGLAVAIDDCHARRAADIAELEALAHNLRHFTLSGPGVIGPLQIMGYSEACRHAAVLITQIADRMKDEQNQNQREASNDEAN